VAVRIRLRRTGKKKEPHYRLVVAEAAAPRDGRFIETIGYYNPRVDPPTITVKQERALWWLKQGAQPSETGKAILVKTGVWEQFTGEPAPTTAAPAAEETAGAEMAEPSVESAEPTGAADDVREDSPKETSEPSLAEGSVNESEQLP